MFGRSQARADAGCVVPRLPVGDAAVENRVLLERTTIRDLALSLIDGRLFAQATALVTTNKRAVLILEGKGRDLAGAGVCRDALQGALITLGVFFGIAILRALDPAETARVLVLLGRQVGRLAHGALPRPGYRPKGKRTRQLFILQGLPGIGPGRAARLLERFGSVEAVVAASVRSLAETEGVGEKTAARIRWALDEPRSRFGDGAPAQHL